jgi:hypothetical protein
LYVFSPCSFGTENLGDSRYTFTFYVGIIETAPSATSNIMKAYGTNQKVSTVKEYYKNGKSIEAILQRVCFM